MLLTVNADAGAAERGDLDAALDVLRAAGPLEVAETASPDDLDDVLRDVGDRQLILAGGDGSLHLALSRLQALGLLDGATLGLIPMGTGNDFARGVGIPLDPEPAARVCAEGRVREFDLLVDDDGEVVVNAAHAGLSAAAAQRASDLKDDLGAVAYPVGAVLAGVREAGYELEVTVDGEQVHRGETLMVGVTNGPCIGGGARLCANAAPDDGLLDVVTVCAVTPAARLAFAAAFRKGTHIDREDVLHVRGHQVTISGEPVHHDVDGEVLGPFRTRTYRMRERAWRLLTPSAAR